PIDVTLSQWDHVLESPSLVGAEPALRLGLRMIKGLSQESAERILQAQCRSPITSAGDLARRADLDDQQLGFLARAGALARLTGHRHQAHWDVTGIARPLPLESTQAA
ncbi:MAG TPA: error-prone DNA polymerase, partial [Gammaproteobacteria bacterium]|nr:error-prone DNA polymerase [Gammaproteobacteria bacterium]